MADKIDSLKIGSTSYDIDLPPDATPSIASLTVSGTTDVSAGTLKAKTLNIPTTSGGSTYGPGSSGQILTSNGTTVYWANASSGANYYHTPSFSSGLKIATGTGVSDLYVPNASTSQAGVVTTGAQTFSGTKTFSNLSTSSFNVEGIWGKGLLDIYDSGDEYASIHLTNDGEYGFIETYANKVSIKGGSSLYIGDDEDVIGGNIHLYDEVSEGYAGILSEDNTIYGYTPSGSSIGFEPDTKNIYINNGSNTRTYTFPDRSGKVALLDDIPSTSDFVKTTGNQTIGGTKTFSDIIISPGIQPSTTASSSYSPNLGATNKKFKNAYLYGYLAVSTDTYAAQDTNSTRYQQGKIINYGTSSSYSVTLQFPTVTSAYTVTLPSKTGTVALTSDIKTASIQVDTLWSTTGTPSTGQKTLNSSRKFSDYKFIICYVASDNNSNGGWWQSQVFDVSQFSTQNVNTSSYVMANSNWSGANHWVGIYYYNNTSFYIGNVSGGYYFKMVGVKIVNS